MSRKSGETGPQCPRPRPPRGGTLSPDQSPLRQRPGASSASETATPGASAHWEASPRATCSQSLPGPSSGPQLERHEIHQTGPQHAGSRGHWSPFLGSTSPAAAEALGPRSAKAAVLTRTHLHRPLSMQMLHSQGAGQIPVRHCPGHPDAMPSRLVPFQSKVQGKPRFQENSAESGPSSSSQPFSSQANEGNQVSTPWPLLGRPPDATGHAPHSWTWAAATRHQSHGRAAGAECIHIALPVWPETPPNKAVKVPTTFLPLM